MQNETIDKLKNAGYITSTADSQGIADQCQISDFPYKFIQLPDMEIEYDPAQSITKVIGHTDDVNFDKITNYSFICCIRGLHGYMYSPLYEGHGAYVNSYQFLSIGAANTHLTLYLYYADHETYKKGDILFTYTAGTISIESPLVLEDICIVY